MVQFVSLTLLLLTRTFDRLFLYHTLFSILPLFQFVLLSVGFLFMVPGCAVNLHALSMQGDQRHLLLAHLFDKPCFLGLLAVKVVFFFIMIELPLLKY